MFVLSYMKNNFLDKRITKLFLSSSALPGQLPISTEQTIVCKESAKTRSRPVADQTCSDEGLALETGKF